MKTFNQFSEDIETRRKELAQRQRENLERFKEKSAASVAARKGAQQKQQEREALKKEIKRELQSEQTPEMKPNLYSQLVARRQATQKFAHIKHVHQELGGEARAQQAAKERRMKAIMSR